LDARTCLALLLVAATARAGEPSRSFTNEDLDRVAPLRAETGGSSPTIPDPAAPKREAPGRAAPNHDREPYWRAEARRVRGRMQILEDKAVTLRQQVEERRTKPGVAPYSDPQIRRLQTAAEMNLARAQQLEADLMDRARREGALPGWIR
jgi:hypothetical protein